MNFAAPEPGLYLGSVMHARLRPVRRRFRYRVFSILVDVDDPGRGAEGSALYSHNRFNVLSFRDRDHGARDGKPLRRWVEDTLKQAGIAQKPDSIRLLCFPRLWGFVFNPLSVFYCYARGRAFAAIYEVNNTFGDTHAYVAQLGSAAGVQRHEADKVLYVSPLIGMDMRYRFALRPPGETLSLGIQTFGPGGLVLTAAQTGRFQPMTAWGVLKTVLTHPLMTLKVVAAIHIEALGTWLRGARHVEKPLEPSVPVSLAVPAQPPAKSKPGTAAYQWAAE